MLTFHTADSHAISVRAKQYQRPEEEGGGRWEGTGVWRRSLLVLKHEILYNLVILSMIRKIRKNPNN